MKEGDVVLLQNTRFRGAEETRTANSSAKSWLTLQTTLCMRRIRFLPQST